MLVALTRGVSDALGCCELSHLPRVPIDVELARVQHRAYEDALRGCGCSVRSLPPDHAFPDSVFVEDVALVFDDVAVITRPGAVSRRLETAAIAPVLAGYRRLTFIQAPGTLDGGDVLRLGHHVFVGRSERSDDAGVEQLAALCRSCDLTVTSVPVHGFLHLKSAVTEVGPATVLVNPRWVDPAAFGDVRCVEVDPAEDHAANGLLVNGSLIYPSSFPRTMRRLQAHGVRVVPVHVSELQKAEGAVTCCSLVFEAHV